MEEEGSRGVLPLGATTTAADSKRDARAAHKRALRASGIARRRMEEEGVRRSSSGSDDNGGGFQARCASSAQKGAASVGNRAPLHGGGGSRGVLPLGATTTAADSKRDARA